MYPIIKITVPVEICETRLRDSIFSPMLFKGKPIQGNDGMLLRTHLALLQKPEDGEKTGFREAAEMACEELVEHDLCGCPLVVISPTVEVLEELLKLPIAEVFLEQCQLEEKDIELIRKKHPECNIRR